MQDHSKEEVGACTLCHPWDYNLQWWSPHADVKPRLQTDEWTELCYNCYSQGTDWEWGWTIKTWAVTGINQQPTTSIMGHLQTIFQNNVIMMLRGRGLDSVIFSDPTKMHTSGTAKACGYGVIYTTEHSLYFSANYNVTTDGCWQ